MNSLAFQPDKSAGFADDALKKSIHAMEQAQQCAVLWFGEIMRRRLYRKLGFSSINHYARAELKFSKTRTGDFIQLARKLEHLPEVRGAIARGDLGYTKAREIVKVASPENESGWVEAALGNSRRELERKVAEARMSSRRNANPGQGELVAAPPVPDLPPAAAPVRLSVEMTPEQFARYEALLEKHHKQGPVGGRTEMILEAMAELVAARGKKAPRGAFSRGPSYQIHLHQCPECGKAALPTSKGELVVGKEVVEAARCDARLSEPGKPNTPTIPPARRRLVLARDRHTCRTPGCGHTNFLEVHHIVPRAKGGRNSPENLITLCGACHRLWHEKPQTMTALAGA